MTVFDERMVISRNFTQNFNQLVIELLGEIKQKQRGRERDIPLFYD